MKMQTAIKKIMFDNGITQNDLAKHENVTISGVSYSLSENKNIRLDTALRYLDFLACTLWIHCPDGQKIPVTSENLSTKIQTVLKTARTDSDNEDRSLFPEAK